MSWRGRRPRDLKPTTAAAHCPRCRRYCCACATQIAAAPLLRNGHVYCSLACAESGWDCGVRPPAR